MPPTTPTSTAYAAALQAGVHDEALDADGAVRPHYAAALDALDRIGPGAAAAAARMSAERVGLALGAGADAQPLPVDPVPRILTAREWQTLERGLEQRARLLDAVVADVYGKRRLVAAGAVPEDVVESCLYLERDLLDAPAPPVHAGVVGFDVIRRPDGRLAVLEDNLLTPGHVAAAAARELLTLWTQVAAPPAEVREPTRRALLGMLDAARGDLDGAAVILADAPHADASWELRWLARLLDVEILTAAQLAARRNEVAVVWQRTSEDRLRDADGGLTDLGDALLEPLRRGTLHVVNRIGCGVADDKRMSRYLPAAYDALLGEEPLIDAVRVLDLALDDEREEAAEADVLFKPRNGAGGRGITADPGDAEPGTWVAQERVAISTHPTVAGDRLEPRRVDLRVFAVRTGDEYTILPGVSRYAASPDALLVNTSQGGGIKDVWT